MTKRLDLAPFEGPWTGTKRLWLSPDAPCSESDSTLLLELAAKGTFARLTYTWSDAGEPQEGLLVVKLGGAPAPRAMVWTDSWHMRDALMVLDGEDEDGAALVARGCYAAPPGPDWGWRIALDGARGAAADGRLVLRMWNATPEGVEALAVEATYGRPLS